MSRVSVSAVSGSLLTAVAVAVAGCSGGHATAVVPSGSVAVADGSSGSAGPDPGREGGRPTDHPVWVIGDLCREHCDDLAGAAERGCPTPEEDLSACMRYLSELYEAVSEVDTRVAALEGEHGDVLSATREALALAQEFAAEGCHRVTTRADAHAAACGDRALAFRGAAAVVGARLQEALTR